MKTKHILRYWLHKDINRDHIRVEWRGPAGLMTSVAVLDARSYGYQRLDWIYDIPPCEVRELALQCLLWDGEYEPAGSALVGYETTAEMDAAADAWGHGVAA